jgi:hypothetical protein
MNNLIAQNAENRKGKRTTRLTVCWKQRINTGRAEHISCKYNNQSNREDL